MEAVEAAQRIENPEEYESKPRLVINDLTKKGMHELRDMAIQYGVNEEDMPAMKKQYLLYPKGPHRAWRNYFCQRNP